MTGYWLLIFIILACALAMHDKPKKTADAPSDAQPDSDAQACGQTVS
ncbi:MAG: hypothetical protein IJL52_07995 [Clostridia bacterium]|nr:hypothetical protein [Clostridia bacterium]